MSKQVITIQTSILAPVDRVWNTWTNPEDILQWNAASPDWHTTKAENDLRVGGRFTSRMEAKDGSMGFDFGGTYDEIITHKLIKYTLDDDRKVEVIFERISQNKSKIIESFEAESTNSIEMQQQGWQALLDNFKNYEEDRD